MMNTTNIDELIKRVNRALVGSELIGDGDEESLNRLAQGIREGRSESRRLSADLLSIASLVVSVCSLVVGLIPLFGSNSEENQKKVYDALIERADDPDIAKDPKIRVVVEVAVEQVKGPKGETDSG